MKQMLAALFLLCALNLSIAGENRAPAQTKCPISGRPVDGSFFADVDGFRVLVAGPAEADEVRKNPNKAFSALAKNREAALPIVWICPSMRNPVAPNYPYVQQAGKRIYYCCRPCQPKIQKNFAGAAAVMKRLAEQGS